VRGKSPDVVIVIGSDPFSSLPHSLMRNLEKIPLICLDPFITPTVEQAEVAFGVAISGLEVAGGARRMDGTIVSLKRAFPPKAPSDEMVLGQLLEGLT